MFIKDFVGVFKKVFSEKDKVFGKVFVFKLVVEVILFIKFCVEKQKKQFGVIDFDDFICMFVDEVVKLNNILVFEFCKKFFVVFIDEF